MSVECGFLIELKLIDDGSLIVSSSLQHNHTLSPHEKTANTLSMESRIKTASTREIDNLAYLRNAKLEAEQLELKLSKERLQEYGRGERTKNTSVTYQETKAKFSSGMKATRRVKKSKNQAEDALDLTESEKELGEREYEAAEATHLGNASDSSFRRSNSPSVDIEVKSLLASYSDEVHGYV